MKKRIAFGMIAALALSTSIACASPVEMEQGQFNVNLGVMISPDAEGDESYNGWTDTYDFDGDTSFYGGITYGITDKWGIQYDYSHYGAEYYEIDFALDANEFNIIYKLNDNVNIFAGYVYAGVDVDYGNGYSEGIHTDGFQAGLTGWYPLGDKVKTFGKIGLGNNSHVYEIGFSYAIADNWDLDLSYRDVEYKDCDLHGYSEDFGYDGVRVGLSTSF